MLESIFWLLVFFFIFSFSIGFVSYGFIEMTKEN